MDAWEIENIWIALTTTEVFFFKQRARERAITRSKASVSRKKDNETQSSHSFGRVRVGFSFATGEGAVARQSLTHYAIRVL